ncbi:MAG: aminopeptidase P family protein, partial [Pseudomonadota bacterium]
MNQHYADTRKITPTRPDGSPDDNDRVEIGPTKMAFDEWAAAGIEVPNLERMRQYRYDRLLKALHDWEFGAVLLTDPLNIRYATDTTNMQLWNTHNPFRWCLLLPDGYMVLWDYARTPHLSSYNPLVREVREGAGLFYFSASDQMHERAAGLTDQVKELMKAHGSPNNRIAVDKLMLDGIRAFEAGGLVVCEGEEMMEKTRMIKGPDEIAAMRCA